MSLNVFMGLIIPPISVGSSENAVVAPAGSAG